MKRVLWSAMAIVALGCHGNASTKSTDKADKAETAKEDDDDAKVLEFDLSGGLHEASGGGLVLPIPASRTYAGLVREIERAATNKSAKGFLIRMGDSSVDWSRAEELGLAFQRLREKSGKPVVCHAHGLDNKSTFFLARACTRIWVSPAGDIDTVGIAAQVVYLKSLLDRFHIHADFLHMGRFKSAAETLTQDGPSNEARESLTAVLSSMRDTWMEGFAAARAGKDMGALLEDGPWGPEEARSKGIIDAVGYEDEARKDAEARAHVTRTAAAFGRKKAGESNLGLSELFKVIAGGDTGTKRPHISIVAAEGSIAMGAGGVLSDSGITAKAMQKTIRKLTNDDSVKAVVLRIESPGGSALASDLIWHDLMELRKKKPLIASVGDMAASGGYYLACAANKIVAERTSIVGSIGVLGGKIVVDEALSELGVHAETFAASPAPGAANRAGYESPFSPWDDATREKVRVSMEAVYELFLSRVSEGRGVPVDAIRAVAEGRIWSGVQGLKLHLVDELGGLGRALDLARTAAKLDAETPVRVEGISESILENLFSSDDEEATADEATLEAALLRVEERRHVVLDKIAEPLRPYIASLAPLVEGELAVAALPYGVVVR
ncbi:MAG TPA: signal peptide peptidase SppA [Polyangiaceae bacterium]|jgi:protease-4|nr:signal peptide peptidase SppA [Polyangiaceae bacterium]